MMRSTDFIRPEWCFVEPVSYKGGNRKEVTVFKCQHILLSGALLRSS